jgi:hypothetical protein
MAKVRQNLAWAVAYNIVAIPIAAGALLPQFDFAMTPSLSGNVYPRSHFVCYAIVFLVPMMTLSWLLLSRGIDGPELHLCCQQFSASAATWVVSEGRKRREVIRARD